MLQHLGPFYSQFSQNDISWGACTPGLLSDCINNLFAMSSLDFSQPKIVESAHEKNGEIGLFELSHSNSLQNSMLRWSNDISTHAACFKMPTSEFETFAGLELAMAMHKCDNIKDY